MLFGVQVFQGPVSEPESRVWVQVLEVAFIMIMTLKLTVVIFSSFKN